jgi:hypothetical protein
VKANLGNQQLSKWKGRPTSGFSLTQKSQCDFVAIEVSGLAFCAADPQRNNLLTVIDNFSTFFRN